MPVIPPRHRSLNRAEAWDPLYRNLSSVSGYGPGPAGESGAGSGLGLRGGSGQEYVRRAAGPD